MKRALLGAACALALAVPVGGVAAQGIPTYDNANLLARGLEHAATIAKWGQQAEHMVQQIRRAEAAYDAVTGVRDLGSAVQAMGVLGIRNPLPINPYAVQGLLNGTGGVSGMTSNLGGLFTGTLSQNRVYESQGGSWIEQEINRNGSGLAGAQAVSLQLYASAAERMQHMDALRGRIDTADDPATRDSLIAQLTAENGAIQNQALQAQALNNFMQSQIALQGQRVQERRVQEIDGILAEARARGVIQ